ncbi:(S)-2-hydroxy-acid oxidase [Pseudovirgaria hyperparasitica]|uniref:Oxidase FUB9 n=1 Tax=Pseudovirgaria hyperparasitica TaxID=470096 RepID=A0A6A6WCD8_9PEZI|nr:(S)-2-hydroxy-acid oxidase [Pseudovirgaria hyperparasitica]KAF2759714.1 (S)-2-hydroxy-acid oxidase [Pseudovirgaria hyperparasitica]
MTGQPVPTPLREKKPILCIDDIKKVADKKLSEIVREFYNSGSREQVTVHENTSAYRKYRLRPRVLVDVSHADPSTILWNRSITFPLCISPAGLQAMAHPDGELATTRACAARGINMAVSSFANYSVEDIRAASSDIGPIDHAMQLYTLRDRDLQLRMIKRAEAAGCKAIFLTADSAVLGMRYHEHRYDFRSPAGLEYPNIEITSSEMRRTTHEGAATGMTSDAHSWVREVPWLRSVCGMEVWIKGVLTAEDVELAAEYGCDGVVVSNHGGRQLDGVVATIDALPECVKAARGRLRVHVDGGIRTGADVFKALALGAECCWIGRPVIWALAYDGEAGVKKMLDLLYAEFKACMQLTGCNSIADITTASLGIVRSDGPIARL